jgi:hypothetical protein
MLRTHSCFLVIASLLTDAGLAQRGVITRAIETEIRENAFAGPVRRVQTPLVITLTYLPSCHPDERIVITYVDRLNSEIEYMRASVPLAEVIEQVRYSQLIDTKAAARLIGVKRKRMTVDTSTVLGWVQEFRTTLLQSMGGEVGLRPLRLDGTLYRVHYRGAIDVTTEDVGSEIGSTGGDDPPSVDWMNKIRGRVEELIKSQQAKGRR